MVSADATIESAFETPGLQGSANPQHACRLDRSPRCSRSSGATLRSRMLRWGHSEHTHWQVGGSKNDKQNLASRDNAARGIAERRLVANASKALELDANKKAAGYDLNMSAGSHC